MTDRFRQRHLALGQPEPTGSSFRNRLRRMTQIHRRSISLALEIVSNSLLIDRMQRSQCSSIVAET